MPHTCGTVAAWLDGSNLSPEREEGNSGMEGERAGERKVEMEEVRGNSK